MNRSINRRSFGQSIAAAAAATQLSGSSLFASQPDDDRQAAETSRFALRYIVGSCMYGYTPLSEIVPEVSKTGATAIDIWPRVHGNQREQLDEMGEEAFAALLAAHDLSLGCITQYKLGPFGLKDEIPLAKRLGCPTIVTGARGPQGLTGGELKNAVGAFVEQMKPHVELAAEHGVTIAIENHGNNLIDSPDSMRYLIDLRPSEHLAIAMAPYHLPQDEKLLSRLIHDLGNGIVMFYAWEHGNGCMQAQPKETELLQMPGRGKLDFKPLLDSLRAVNYAGWTEIFMHPYPRGIAILDSTAEVTAEINRSRNYLERLL